MRQAATRLGGGVRSTMCLMGTSAICVALLGGVALAQSGLVPPGIYTPIAAALPTDPVAPMQILMGCTSNPIVFHSDGLVVSKALAAAGGYAEEAQGFCSLDAGTLWCGGSLTNSEIDDVRLVSLESGHFQMVARNGNASVLGRCDPQTFVAAAADGSALDAVLARSDGGPELRPEDTVVMAGNDFYAEQSASGDFIAEEIHAVAPVSGTDEILPPGIYASLGGGYAGAEDVEYDRMMGCAQSPTVIYPDGRLLLKELDRMAAEIGLAPYRVGFDAQCSVEGGIATCAGQAFRDPGGPGTPQTIVGTLALLDDGFSVESDGRTQSFLACDLADLDQQVDGISVLAEIIRRPDPGPFPDLGDIALDTSGLTSMPQPQATPGDWDGTYIAYFSEGLGEARIDVAHTAENPDQAFARLGFNIGNDAGECAPILGAGACEELEINSGWTEAVRGTIIDGNRLLIVYEQGLWQSGVERELRLVELVRNGEGGFRLTRYNPDTGADLVVEGIYGPNYCETGQYSLIDIDCSQLGMQRIGLASGAASDAEIKGLFETAPERVAPLLAHTSEIPDTQIDTVGTVESGVFETGSWHGSVNLTIDSLDMELGIDVAQMVGSPHAWGELYSTPLINPGQCGALDALACVELEWLGTDSAYETAGTLIHGDSLLVLVRLGTDGPGADEVPLRLIEIRREGEAARFTYYHPEHGAIYSATSGYEPHWCDDPANAPDSFCFDTRSMMTDMVFSDGAEFIGMFGQGSSGLDILLSHAPHLAGLMTQAGVETSSHAASDTDWGGLPPGIWTNLMGYDQEDGLLAQSCVEAPSVSYSDGKIISKELIGERYAIQSIFTCMPQPGGGIGCRVSDGVEELAVLSSVQFRPDGATTEICYALDGETYCDTLHQCSPDIVPSDRIQSIIARQDGGVPLALR